MIEPLPPEVLVELEGLLERATARPWSVGPAGNSAICGDEDGGAYTMVALTPAPNSPFRSARAQHWREIDGALIAKTVNNLPALISTARSTEAMRAEIADLQAEVSANGHWCAQAESMRAENERLKAESLMNYNDATQLSTRLEAAEVSLKAAREALETTRDLVKAAFMEAYGVWSGSDQHHAAYVAWTNSLVRKALLSTITLTGDEDV